MSDAAISSVFDAWARARADVYSEWSKLTDLANLEPRIPKAMRVAIDLVMEHGGSLSPEVQGDLIARLNGRWEHAIVRSVREILRNEETSDKEKVQDLLNFVTVTGLPMPEAPKPLPAVRIEDIRVITWMAVSPAN
jgi:hypothetical protein